ncbi:MAG: hypothetical protein O2954_10745 [bacterium]|nr:hypothetical protein [bacterium]
MRCDHCGARPATRVLTQIVAGEKQLIYRCDECTEASSQEEKPPKLERPCDRCGKREGRIKLKRLHERYQSLSYLCEICAGVRR